MKRKLNLREVKRRNPTRAPNSRIVLVCEGIRTERIYFSLFLSSLKAANIKLEIVDKECGTDPTSVIRYAKDLFREDSGIDECYCVIDRDSHANFASALDEASDQSKRASLKKRIFRAIVSYPCIEVWFLYHFQFYRAPFAQRGKNSSSDEAVKKLRNYLPDYEKNSIDSIKSLLDKTDIAIKNASRAYDEVIFSGNHNPSTEIFLIIEKIQSYRNN